MFWRQITIISAQINNFKLAIAPFTNPIKSQFNEVEIWFSGLWMEFLPNFPIRSLQIAGVTYAIKFILLIALFTFVRGGLPRYRYDFLTKVGWIQMLNFILFTAFASILPYMTL